MFLGVIGSQINDDKFYLKPVVAFEAVKCEEEKTLEFPEEVLKDLSTDQRLLLQYILAIHNGEVPKNVVNLKPGNIFYF